MARYSRAFQRDAILPSLSVLSAPVEAYGHARVFDTHPDAVRRPINKRRSRLNPTIVCVHTMVGTLRGTDTYFRQVGVDSHFGVGNSTDGTLDGVVYQWADTDLVAYANLDGNDDCISIETSDGGNPNDPWSPKALDALVDLIMWACETHNIPAELINGNKDGASGVAYHRQGCDHGQAYRPDGWPYDQWRVPGGVRWSKALGKTCPGDVRIRQLVDEVIPRVQLALEGDDDMPDPRISDEEAKTLRQLHAAIDAKDSNGYSVGAMIELVRDMRPLLTILRQMVASITERKSNGFSVGEMIDHIRDARRGLLQGDDNS